MARGLRIQSSVKARMEGNKQGQEQAQSNDEVGKVMEHAR